MEQSKISLESKESLRKWREKEKVALELLKIVGHLRFDKSIELIMFREDIYDSRPSKVLDMHLNSIHYIDSQIEVEESLNIARAIDSIQSFIPSKIDIGKLSAEWHNEKQDYQGLEEFIHFKLRNFIGSETGGLKSRDVVLYGFGRIGRLLTRRLVAQTGRGEQLLVKAIVLRQKMASKMEEMEKRVALFASDSVHGDFHGTVEISKDGNELIINGNRIQIIYASNPNDINYAEYGIQDAIVIDNTGVWRDKFGLSQHLRSGASKVILTAPAKDVPNIVYGVNHDEIDLTKDNILSAASCTTNAIVPLIKIIDSNFGIEKGHIETIHAYTSDQNLLDNFHKKPRRGRAAAINMVLTTTGAAKAVTKVMPHLKDKMTGNAVRVPTPNVSLAIMNLTIEKPTDLEELLSILKREAMEGELVEQIHYSDSTEYVSSHAIGMNSTSVLDAPSTIVSNDGKTVTLYAWYDNEYGYTCQVVRFAKHVAMVRRACYF
jgi:glyceraldehyde 3-phosphate dehydrogenase